MTDSHGVFRIADEDEIKKIPIFKHGDVVVLKSGSVPMVIDGINSDGDRLECLWFVGGECISHLFHRDTVRHVKTKEEE